MAITTLAPILARVGEWLPGAIWSGFAVSGTAADVTDPKIPGSVTSWKDGTVIIVHTDDGAAPQGESRVILSFAAGTGVVVPDPDFSAAVAAGDFYTLINKRYPRSAIVAEINEALSRIRYGEIDDTILTSDTDLKKYTLSDPTDPADATGITEQTLLQVWIASNTSEPYEWEPIYFWHIEQAAGVTSLLLDDFPRYDNAIIRLVYEKQPDPLFLDADSLPEQVHMDLVAAMAAESLIRQRHDRKTKPPASLTNALNRALNRVDTMKLAHMPVLPDRKQLPAYGRV